MKSITKITIATAFISLSVISCAKHEIGEASTMEMSKAEMTTTDSVSIAASQQVETKKFIKTANIDMEVKNVYDASIAIEKSLVKLGGFVTKSEMKAQTLSERTFNTSDTEATLVRKYQNENTMQVRVPTEFLGDFLNDINQNKLFLNARIINADDVTANIALANLDAQRQQKKEENINQLKANKDKVELADDNYREANDQKVANINIADQLKYSTVDIYLKEPHVSVAQIPIANTQNYDNQFKSNFGFELKNALVEGFYMIQQIVVFLVSIWPILLIIGGIIYLNKKKFFLNRFSKAQKS
ncbi:DUF4349 domain-containing protein [Soonwooa sp.]|uniref:DUF4349 domain-containing protein n=1 Tax=Soonwooa sp. TaxID=1938592 RepID=UPI0028AF6348|nr:DUF4349 domain-containing protein [Soonwooa sp.]